ncbi:MAG: hypothetical protein HY646_10610 [Acidobacteria bacterium]|nr:hypothetical protein [Acidobacteriota bacterium]
MVKAGLSEDIIRTAIASSKGNFDLGPDGLISLKTAGVSDGVIKLMQGNRPTTGTTSVETPGSPRPIWNDLTLNVSTPEDAVKILGKPKREQNADFYLNSPFGGYSTKEMLNARTRQKIFRTFIYEGGGFNRRLSV